MEKRPKIIGGVLILLLFAFCFMSLSVAQEVLPKPGEVIDKSNYQKYLPLMGVGMEGGFADGWGGLAGNPIIMKITETHPCPLTKANVEVSKKNNGKYTLEASGLIGGGYDYLGLPFPDVTPADKDFALKLMWNCAYKYMFDDYDQTLRLYAKRKGESPSYTQYRCPWQFFVNRMFDDPKPTAPNPLGLQKVSFWYGQAPNTIRNQVLMQYRYTDFTKSDAAYIYLPSLRRVLRGEAGQRSTPITGSCISLDDVEQFDGRPQDFNFKFVGERKTLCIVKNDKNLEMFRDWKISQGVTWPSEDWEVRDAYVIEITPKDPKYPQSKKVVFIDKENLIVVPWATAYDRAGKLWKLLTGSYKQFSVGQGDNTTYINTQLGVDMQAGFFNSVVMMNPKMNNNGFTYDNWTQAALIKAGR
jgi:hypothetical protein